MRQKRSTGERTFVPLTTNPEGSPLLVSGSTDTLSSTEGYVDIMVQEGSTMATFDLLSLTCGSNAARSSKASAAARAWDWEYHMLISQVLQNEEHVSLQSVMSRHITTDSNRSLTREKRKASDEGPVAPVGQPPSKKSCKAPTEETGKELVFEGMRAAWGCA
jgi:hypothetical protein